MAKPGNVPKGVMVALVLAWLLLGGKAIVGYLWGIRPGMVRMMVTQDGGREPVEVIRWDSPNGYVFYRVPGGAIHRAYPDFFINATSP
jgi:hypothetical protein